MTPDVVTSYLSFLWTQFQYDWSIMSNPWIFWTIVPEVVYCAFFFLKWMVMLAPVTVPLLVLRGNLGAINFRNIKSSGDFQRN